MPISKGHSYRHCYRVGLISRPPYPPLLHHLYPPMKASHPSSTEWRSRASSWASTPASRPSRRSLARLCTTTYSHITPLATPGYQGSWYCLPPRQVSYLRTPYKTHMRTIAQGRFTTSLRPTSRWHSRSAVSCFAFPTPPRARHERAPAHQYVLVTKKVHWENPKVTHQKCSAIVWLACAKALGCSRCNTVIYSFIHMPSGREALPHMTQRYIRRGSIPPSEARDR